MAIAKLKRRNNLAYFDGVKAVTIWGDEGWSILSGNDKERPDTETFYTARVPIVYRGMLLRANCVASIPFDLVNDKTGDVVDSTDDWQNVCGFLPNPQRLFWKIEAGWVVAGRSYIYQSKNAYNIPKVYKPLAPKAISYDTDKNVFTRQVNGHDLVYPPALDENDKPARGESIVALWMPDPDVEKGPPLKYPGKAALQAMGVLFNMDEAATGFFKRGMLHAMLFSVPPGTTPSDKEMLDDKIKNFLTGIKNAWRSLLINFDIIKMTDIGGDLSSLANIPLTKEKREDVSIALGIPMSKLFTESAAGLGGKGVVDADDRRLILDTGLPEWIDIAGELNDQTFLKLDPPLRLVDRHEQMPQLQIEQAAQAATYTAYFNALNTNMPLAEALAGEFGMDWSDDFTKAMIQIQKDKEAKAAEMAKNVQQSQGAPSQDNITAANPNAQTATPEMVAQKTADLKRYERKALKSIGKAVSFESDVIPSETMAYIDHGLPGCKTAEDVKALFAGIEEEKVIPMPESGLFALAAAINKAVELEGVKYNENHDELGRFAEGDGGGGVMGNPFDSGPRGREKAYTDKYKKLKTLQQVNKKIDEDVAAGKSISKQEGEYLKQQWADSHPNQSRGGSNNSGKIDPSGERSIRDNFNDIKQYNYLGVRGLQPDEHYKVGDTARSSRDWDYETDTSSSTKLNGTSCLALDNNQLDSPDDLLGQINGQMDDIAQYGNGTVVLLGGYDAEEGTDPRESIIKSAKVLAIIKKK
jgi:hypothetical protein